MPAKPLPPCALVGFQETKELLMTVGGAHVFGPVELTLKLAIYSGTAEECLLYVKAPAAFSEVLRAHIAQAAEKPPA